MPIAVTGRASDNNGTTSTSTITTASFTPSANSLLLFGGGAQIDGAASQTLLGSISGGSLSWGSPIQSYENTAAVGSEEPTADYNMNMAVWSAAVGGSPSAMTIVFDGTASATGAWYSATALDVTGHNTSSPIVQSAKNKMFAVGGTASGTLSVTLGSTPAVGNVVLVYFAVADDSGTGLVAPTIGGQSMTQVYNQSGADYTIGGWWYREITGAESTNVITCSDLGTTVFKAGAIAIEIAAAAGGGASDPTPRPLGYRSPSKVRSKVAQWWGEHRKQSDLQGSLLPSTVSGGLPLVPDVNAKHRRTVRLARASVPEFYEQPRRDLSPGQVSTTDYRWPTTVSGSGRYLQDQVGSPWFGIGDTAWSMVGQLTNAEIVQYLTDCNTKGINLVLISAPEPYYANNAPNNIDGVSPFTGTAFQSTLNNTYWARVDYAVNLAQNLGITLMICPFYLGFTDADGWGAQVTAASDANMVTYAGYLSARYGSFPNIMWIIGHDRPTMSATLLARGKAFADKIQLDTSHLVTIGGNHPRDIGGTDTFGIGSEEWAGSGVSWDVDTHYDYSGQIAVNSYTMWGLSPTTPFIFFEGIYEQEAPGGPLPIGDVLLREQMWGPFCAGATATIFGNNPIWGFGSTRLPTAYTGTWQANLDYEGRTDLAAFATIVKSLGTAWATMAADTTSTFVTTQGTGSDRVACRFNTNGGLIYHPAFTAGTITVDLTEFAAGWSTVTITRYDPRSGATTALGPYSTAGTQTLSAPAANSAGDNDWLYVVTGTTPSTGPIGTGSPTLNRVTATGVGKYTATGIGAATLNRDVAVGAGSTTGVGPTGSGSPSLTRRTAAGAGSTTAPPVGTGTPTLNRATGAGVGKYTAAGTSATTLTRATGAGVGKYTAAGTGTPTLNRATGAGVGKYTVSGTGTPTLNRATATGTGSTDSIRVGSGAPVLNRAIGAGTGTSTGIGPTGSGSPSLIRHTASGTGSTTAPPVGTGAPTLARHTATSAGYVRWNGTGSPVLNRVTAVGSGSTSLATVTGTAAVTLQRRTANGVGVNKVSGTGAPVLQRRTANGRDTVSSGLSVPPSLWPDRIFERGDFDG